MLNKTYLFIAKCFAILILPNITLAHHFMDNENPSSMLEGLFSGIAHPIIGIDHLIFLIFTSIIAYLAIKKITPISIFIVSTIIGSFFSLIHIELPMLELLIIFSILFLGLFFFLYRNFPLNTFIYPFIIFGLMHGNAYGKSIIESPFSAQFSYVMGFIIIQILICLLSYFTAKLIFPDNSKSGKFKRPYLLGSLNVFTGLILLVNYF